MKTILTYAAISLVSLVSLVMVTVQVVVLSSVAGNVVHMVSKSLNGN